jgi:hypothetical protein
VTTGVFENRVLRRIFGPRRDDITGNWRKLHNEELNGSSGSGLWGYGLDRAGSD